MIKIEKLFYLHILHDIDLTIEDNITILGENGAGKSTLARLVCGLTDSEAIKGDTKSINYIPPVLNVFDENLTLVEYLESAFYDSVIDKKAIEEVLKRVDLKNDMIAFLSSGQKQLAQIAIALLQNSQITIFDEPTANLDPKNTRKIFEILKNSFEIKVVITHDLNLAYKLGYDVVYIEKGRIKYNGDCKTFFDSGFYGDAISVAHNGVLINL